MTRPIVWTIAGSDSGGGAGIQADLKTMNALGVHGCSVITALTAQNTQGVDLIELCSPAMLKAQLEALSQDLPPVAIKLGMLGDAEGIQRIAEAIASIQRTQSTFVICDPVMVSTSGHALRQENTLAALTTHLLPHVHLLTPNLPEAEILTGQPIRSAKAMEAAAQALLKLGVQSVLIKGGHFEGQQGDHDHEANQWSQDFWTDGSQSFWLTSPRQETRHTHGTGCTLSAAMAACVGLGFNVPDAIVIAKAYVNQGIRLAPALGQGHGPLAHLGWPETHEDLPWLTPTAEAGQNRPEFSGCGSRPLGFYPIVPRFEWLEKLLPLGVSTIQLRIKDLEGEELEREIAQASAYAHSFNCRLFINDYWQLALKYGAYGVHLGQDDLKTADLEAIHKAGLKLGLSTHCYQEVARALAVRPSYMAVGPVFHTTTKTMYFRPQGLEAVRRWRRSLPYPLVAIAGIFLHNAPEVLATGVDSLAVVRDITQAENLPERVAQWLALFEEQSPQPLPLSPQYPKLPSP
ncbi:bifunctional hydroxymethylpyrimidine kinase/phosphomethylpyrimidine kinase [Vampirovibrio sp.]|uniref:bifunctional hydroxymethylpyrimidine kinase/phosphomethylpyrimidine kinase n=1 Tax=Vampirovibrio sp. TaxID=2717857 RepID=UPI003594567D